MVLGCRNRRFGREWEISLSRIRPGSAAHSAFLTLWLDSFDKQQILLKIWTDVILWFAVSCGISLIFKNVELKSTDISLRDTRPKTREHLCNSVFTYKIQNPETQKYPLLNITPCHLLIAPQGRKSVWQTSSRRAHNNQKKSKFVFPHPSVSAA